MDCSQARIDLLEVAHRIAAIAVVRRAIEHRHDVQHIDAQFLQIGQFPVQTLQVPGKTIAIQRHTYPFLAEKPVIVPFACQIRFPQMGDTLDIAKRQRLDQANHLILEIRPFAIQQPEQRMYCIEVRPKTRVKMAQSMVADFVLQFMEYFIQQCVGSLFVHQ